MPKYAVTIRVIKTLEKPMIVYANDHEAAGLKAEKIVSEWKDIEEAQAVESERIDT